MLFRQDVCVVVVVVTNRSKWRLVNRAPDSTDIFALTGLTALKLAVELANSKDGENVRQALVRSFCVCVCVCVCANYRSWR